MFNRVRNIRQRLDFSQPQFAELFDRSKSAITQYETDRVAVPPAVAEKLTVLEAALAKDEALGARLAKAGEGKTGFARVHAIWVEVVK